MEQSEGSMDIVHPEVRAHINSLVSAVSIYMASPPHPASPLLHSNEKKEMKEEEEQE